MRIRSWPYVCIALAFALLGSAAAGCTPGGTPASAAGDKLGITVSILPQKYFVERVGGDRVEVTVMVPPGGDPHTYEPKPEQMQVLSKAAAYMSIGVSFEDAWMDRIRSANPSMLVVDTAQGIERMPMAADHAHEGEGNLDPHIWTSPRLVKVQAQTIYDALVQLDPAHEAAFRANLDAFSSDIDGLESSIRSSLAGTQSKRFMVFHPSWGYFARDFGLEMISIEIEGKEPSAAEMAQVIAEAKDSGIRVIFAQPELSTRSAKTIAAEIGGEVLLISPLAYEWMDNLEQVATTFAKVLGGP